MENFSRLILAIDVRNEKLSNMAFSLKKNCSAIPVDPCTICHLFLPNKSPLREHVFSRELPQWLNFLRKSSSKAHLVLSRNCFLAQGLWRFASNFPIFSYCFLLAQARLGNSTTKFVQGFCDHGSLLALTSSNLSWNAPLPGRNLKLDFIWKI